MKTIPKALVGTVAAGAMALGSATPAMARDRHDGISTGDVIAGALILGGIAAVASAASSNNGGYIYNGNGYGNGYNGYRYGYNRAGDPRSAVEQCVYAAERNASRYSYGGRAKVTDIRDIDARRDGYKVRGRIAVNTRSGDWRRGWGNDYRGWNSRYNGYDAGSFTCDVRYGQVVDLDYNGIRGLR
jgi:hypothetical protein